MHFDHSWLRFCCGCSVVRPVRSTDPVVRAFIVVVLLGSDQQSFANDLRSFVMFHHRHGETSALVTPGTIALANAKMSLHAMHVVDMNMGHVNGKWDREQSHGSVCLHFV